MNQKGIIWMPIIIWTIVISGTVFIAQDAVKKGYLTINSPYISKEIPTPQPTTFPTPLPTYKPNPTSIPKTSPQGQVQGIQSNQNNPKPKYDGTRTGRIIDYKALCEGKTIKIYENEMIPFSTRSGTKILSTQGDIDCYYKKLQQTDQQNAQPIIVRDESTNSTPQVSSARLACVDQNHADSVSCLNQCNNKYQQDKNICAWAYTGSNPGIVEDPNKYSQCTDEIIDDYDKCGDDCYNAQVSANNNCPK